MAKSKRIERPDTPDNFAIRALERAVVLLFVAHGRANGGADAIDKLRNAAVGVSLRRANSSEEDYQTMEHLDYLLAVVEKTLRRPSA